MTYPPQGPGPYGPQQPDPYQQGPYGQQPPWAVGPQGGFPMGPPPKQPRTGLITSLIIVAILVVGGGGIGLYLLLNKEDQNNGSGDKAGEGGNPRTAAQTYVRELETALNTQLQDVDLAPLKPVACSKDFTQMSDQLEDAKDFDKTSSASPGTPDEIRIRMEDFKETSDGATFTMTEREVGGDDGDSREMTVAKEDDAWKVCGIFQDDTDSPPSTGEDGPSEDGPSQAPSGQAPPNPFPTT